MYWPEFNVLIAYVGGNAPAGTLCDLSAGLQRYTLLPSLNNLSEGPCDGFTDIGAGAAYIGSLAFNGGPTRTHAIGFASAAKDAGDQPSCDDYALRYGDHDQRGPGYAMTYGPACDVGSYEYQLGLTGTTTGPIRPGGWEWER
jgi:hypothetical protein